MHLSCAAAESNEGQLTSLFHLPLWSHVVVCLDDSQIMMEYYHAKCHAFTSTGLGQYRRCRHVCYTSHVERDLEVGVPVMQCVNHSVCKVPPWIPTLTGGLVYIPGGRNVSSPWVRSSSRRPCWAVPEGGRWRDCSDKLGTWYRCVWSVCTWREKSLVRAPPILYSCLIYNGSVSEPNCPSTLLWK